MIKKYGSFVFLIVLLSGCSSFFLGTENLDEPVDLPSNPELVTVDLEWSHDVGDGTLEKELKLRPAILDGSIYAVSADEVLAAFSFDDGERLWKINTGNPIAAGVAADSGVVVVGSKDGQLLAFSADDGTFLWSYQLSSEILSKPFAAQGIVVARTIDGQVIGLNITDGQPAWKNVMEVSDLSIRGNADPIFLQGLILFTTSRGKLNVYDIRDGKKAFAAPVAIGRGQTEVERIVDLLATPAISGSVLFVSSYRNETIAIDLRDSSLLWRSEKSSSRDLYVDDRYLYLIDKNSIISALDKQTGKVAWSSEVLKGRRISPLSGNNDGELLVIDQEGILSVLSADDGSMQGYRSVGDSRSYIAPEYNNSRWITYTSDGALSVFSLEHE